MKHQHSIFRPGTNGWRQTKGQAFQYICSPEVEESFNYFKLRLWGLALLLCALGVALLGTYSLVISKVTEASGIGALDLIKFDRYYCLLIPMTIPVSLVAVYLNWLSMKFFKHA
mmetsp:Transcript_18606/g.25797  ORF Transcript_18606/g.25797 Transcript_18606/m.25797 type:complete len:114 (-) Transcript_18606:52-393(-)